MYEHVSQAKLTGGNRPNSRRKMEFCSKVNALLGNETYRVLYGTKLHDTHSTTSTAEETNRRKHDLKGWR